MSSPSIRNSLLIRCGIGVGVLLSLLSIGIYLYVRHGLYKELDQSIEQTAALLANQVELENEHITYEWQEGMGTNKNLIDTGLFQFWDETTGKTTRSPGLQSLDLPKFCGQDDTPLFMDIKLPDNNHQARAMGMRIYPFVLPEERERMKERGTIASTQSIPHILVVAKDAKPVQRVLTRMRWILTGGTLLTLGMGFLLIEWVIRTSLRPIDLLTQQVGNRTGSQLDSALEVPKSLPSELSGLAANFDSLLGRVAKTRQRERDFIRHAAHELRTPIAELLATADLSLSKPRKNEAYIAYLETCRKTAIDLGELVKRLTALSRCDQSEAIVCIEAIDLTSLVEYSIPRFQALFDQSDLRIVRTGDTAHLQVSGDRALTQIIINNLLDNAASHSPVGSEIHISLQAFDDRVELRVANPADNLPEDLERLFEPLFRRDGSRQVADSHLGIGLTLSLNATQAMGGTLMARRTQQGWIELTLELPRSTE